MCAFPKGVLLGSNTGQFALWVYVTSGDFMEKDNSERLFYPIRIWKLE